MKTEFSADALGYYKILGVSCDADDNTIKQSYRDRAKLWHPDHNPGKEATENFQKLSVAYDVLKDEKNRLAYDLLSQAYTAKDFPEIGNLKAYTDRSGKENPFLRVFSLRRITGEIIKYKDKKNDEICSQPEALGIVFKTSLWNWFLGWWNWPAFIKNAQAVKSNFACINQNQKENFTLLVHNALAYAQENKKDKALFSALQALDYANPFQKDLLKRFIYFLGENVSRVRVPKWNFSLLKYIQLVIPVILVVVILLPASVEVVTDSQVLSWFNSKKEINYHQEVKFRSGGETFDDMVVSKVINIPVDTQDLTRLYHLKEAANVMYGPSDDFDILAPLRARTTVRITGRTPDQVWLRIMMDDGTMGFVRAEMLNPGIGREIPVDSKIFTVPVPN